MRLLLLTSLTIPAVAQWTSVGGNSQHTGLSSVAAQSYGRVKWSTAIDQTTAGQSGDILAHYGSPIITAANTVFVPVHSGVSIYQVEVRDGADGSLRAILPSGWIPPASDWVPSFAPGLSARNIFYMPDANGTVSYVNDADAPTPVIAGNVSFYGVGSGDLSVVKVSTPIVSDRVGNVFFGFVVEPTTGIPPSDESGVPLVSGIARINYRGVGSWTSAIAAANFLNPAITGIPLNSAPALSPDQQTLYFPVTTQTSIGYLVSVRASSLEPIAQMPLLDPYSRQFAFIFSASSASPMVGPDGEVYFGVLEHQCCVHNDRGWLLHFDASLSRLMVPGSFGWDSTPSIVPSDLVPSYQGHSSYLIFSKYNNYQDPPAHGDGNNKIAILDPHAIQRDPILSTVTVMNEVITISGITPDGAPPAVKEWCINTAAIDQVTKSAIVNSEDGTLYRWDFTTNTFSERIKLTAGVGEAYTPTVIGPDGTAYAINDGYLFAVGQN